jgi:ABC-type polysaccharide/polyol phosphate export permease
MTPIIIPMTFLRENHLQKFFALNPLTWFLTLLRNPVLEGAWPPLAAYLVPAVTAMLFAGAAVWMLVKCERRLIFHL